MEGSMHEQNLVEQETEQDESEESQTFVRYRDDEKEKRSPQVKVCYAVLLSILKMCLWHGKVFKHKGEDGSQTVERELMAVGCIAKS